MHGRVRSGTSAKPKSTRTPRLLSMSYRKLLHRSAWDPLSFRPYLRWLDVSVYDALPVHCIEGSKQRAEVYTYLIWCHNFVEHLVQVGLVLGITQTGMEDLLESLDV